MSTCLKARRNHHFDSSLFQSDGFVRCGSRSERDNRSLPCLVQYLFWWNTVNKREGRNVRIEKHAHLILKPDRFVRCKFRLPATECLDMWRQMRQSRAECCSVRCTGFRIFHRNPQVHRKWIRRQRTDLGDHIFDHFVAAKRSEWDSYIRHVSPWEIDRYLNAY